MQTYKMPLTCSHILHATHKLQSHYHSSTISLSLSVLFAVCANLLLTKCFLNWIMQLLNLNILIENYNAMEIRGCFNGSCITSQLKFIQKCCRGIFVRYSSHKVANNCHCKLIHDDEKGKNYFWRARIMFERGTSEIFCQTLQWDIWGSSHHSWQ